MALQKGAWLMPVWCVARPTAAPCGHFAALPLVRSTFGLRGYPPLRFGAFPHSALAVKQAHDALNQSLCGFRRDTPARGFGRASLAVGQRGFLPLLSHSRRYAIRRVGRLASLAVCRRVVLVVPRRGEKDAGGSSLSLRGVIFAHDPSGFRKAKATFGRSILPTTEG